MYEKIFILGCGRSGTHMIGDVIAACGCYEYNPEEQPFFDLSCKINIYNDKKYLPELINELNKKNNYIDKCHPNIFIVSELRNAFPNAFFIYAYRNSHDTIKSMIKHGTIIWNKNNELPYPNKFIGLSQPVEVTEENKYSILFERWKSHFNEFINNISLIDFLFNYDDRMNCFAKLEKILNKKFDKSLVK